MKQRLAGDSNPTKNQGNWARVHGTCQESGVSHHQRWYSITRSDPFITPTEAQLGTESGSGFLSAAGCRSRRIDGIVIHNLKINNDYL